ncbi:MAG: glycosyltransferase family 4 protein [Candidatus Thiodiazotropha taylori]|nr:glycosyltransferase family 4 protein [Candidatus Thiodiazotropha taylori]
MQWIHLGGLTLILSALLTWLLRHYALQQGLMDNPNARSSHLMATPRGGGLAFVLVYLGLLLWAILFDPARLQGVEPLAWVLLLGGGLVALIGFIDDHRDLSARLRFMVHLLAAVVAVGLIGTPAVSFGPWLSAEGWWLGILFVPLLVWLLNLYNFMDGIDGIASLQAISVLCSASMILFLNHSSSLIVLWQILLCCGVAGFLVWNWPPAKIFMGDAASGFLGFSLGVFACFTAQHFGIDFWSWVILLGLFVTDASWTLVRRMLNGEQWYRPHAKHAYQILARQRLAQFQAEGLSAEKSRAKAHRWVVLAGLTINLGWLTPLAWLASEQAGWGAMLAVVAYLPLLYIEWRVGAGSDRNGA